MKTYIQLRGSVYEVRAEGNERQVKVGRRWLTTDEFLTFLIKNNRRGELRDLVLYGFNKEAEKAK